MISDPAWRDAIYDEEITYLIKFQYIHYYFGAYSSTQGIVIMAEVNPCSAAPGCTRIAETHPMAAPGYTQE